MAPRDTLSIRISAPATEVLRQRAEAARVTRSDYVRALLAEALVSPAVLAAAERRLKGAL